MSRGWVIGSWRFEKQ